MCVSECFPSLQQIKISYVLLWLAKLGKVEACLYTYRKLLTLVSLCVASIATTSDRLNKTTAALSPS